MTINNVISIPNDIEIGGATYYQINIKLPLRSFIVKRRYSDFEQLITNLCNTLGINTKDFPYQLPAKRINWLNKKESLVQERKLQLTTFLTQIIKDKSLQNEPLVLEFLQLPINFRFNNDLFKDGNNDLTIDETSVITPENWLQLYRSLRQEIQECQIPSSIQEKIKTKDKINRVYQPTITKLLDSLSSLSISNQEREKRTTLINQLQSNIDTIANSQLQQPSQRDGLTNSKRVLGAPMVNDPPRETSQTIPLSNTELLQQQIQIHKQQDQEAEQLRYLIARQRNIGELIHNEVEEQNLLLDRFNEEVEVASEKVKQARYRARKIA